MASATSLDVWYRKMLPNIRQAEEAYLNALERLGRATNEKVARSMGKLPHETSGRRISLLRANLIKIVGREVNEKGNGCDVLEPNYPKPVQENNQLNLF